MSDLPNAGGILIHCAMSSDAATARQCFLEHAGKLNLDRHLDAFDEADGRHIRFKLRQELQPAWVPDHDTLQLGARLKLDVLRNDADLEREILLAMLAGPVAFEFPSYEELAASIRIRKNIVHAARKTGLAFDTEAAERPEDFWTYSEERGFTVLPGKSLFAALQKATRPDISGKYYSFSCYRATEYVILLGIAQELASCNPILSFKLQKQFEARAIKSGKFHEAFLREYGSIEEPLPLKYYVPGGRLWFRNPDSYSSDVSGYEGSWVLYLGGGQFTNFWKPERPYTLTTKCVEMYHWRNATYRDAAGKLCMDEDRVEALVEAALQDPEEVERILQVMLRLRDPAGVYADGGCIDASREYPRLVCPATADIQLIDY